MTIQQKIDRERITPHVMYSEIVKSETAQKYNISNNPRAEHMVNIKVLLLKVFEPLRYLIGRPIRINSLFRSKTLNRKIGGVPNSQHLCINDSAAMDISAMKGVTNNQLGRLIMEKLEFDQLIFEKVNHLGHSGWIHVSYNKTGNRNQVLIHKVNNSGQHIYLPFDEKMLDVYGEY